MEIFFKKSEIKSETDLQILVGIRSQAEKLCRVDKEANI